jgi:hypothetical protein
MHGGCGALHGQKAEGRGGGGGGRGREGAQGPEGLAEANRDLSNGTRRVAEVARAFASARRLRGGLKTLFTVSRSILGQTTRHLDQRDRVGELYAVMPLRGVLTDRGGPCRLADSNCTAGCKGHTARRSKRRARRRAPWQPQRSRDGEPAIWSRVGMSIFFLFTGRYIMDANTKLANLSRSPGQSRTGGLGDWGTVHRLDYARGR